MVKHLICKIVWELLEIMWSKLNLMVDKPNNGRLYKLENMIKRLFKSLKFFSPQLKALLSVFLRTLNYPYMPKGIKLLLIKLNKVVRTNNLDSDWLVVNIKYLPPREMFWKFLIAARMLMPQSLHVKMITNRISIGTLNL